MRILEHRRNKRDDAAKTMEQELEQMITEQSGSQTASDAPGSACRVHSRA